jgi:hypothetical protein
MLLPIFAAAMLSLFLHATHASVTKLHMSTTTALSPRLCEPVCGNAVQYFLAVRYFPLLLDFLGSVYVTEYGV